MEVVAEDRILCLGRREAFLLGAHAPEHPEHCDEEVTGAAAGVHHRHVDSTVRPITERARRRGAVLVEAQVLPAVKECRRGVTCGPPCSERVLQQESNHVVLGEKLCDGREVRPANLDA